MRRVLATAFSGVLLSGALVACSSSSDDATPTPTSTATSNEIACNWYNNMEADIKTITGQGESGEKVTVADARKALSEVQTAVVEVQKTGNAQDATATELADLTQTYQADLTPLDADAPISKAKSATPSPSPAFDTLQNQIYTTYQKMGAELGC